MMYALDRTLKIVSSRLFLPVLFAQTALAVEGPVFNVSVQSNNIIYTATPATSSVPGFLPHINFPYMKQRADGTLEVTYTVGQTHGAGVFGMSAYSSDGGRTWSGHTTTPPATPNSSIVRPLGQFSYGVSMAFDDPAGRTSWQNGRYVSINGGTTWSASTNNWSTGSISYLSAYNNHGDIVQSGSTLMTTAYAQRVGSSTQEQILFVSTDNGINWSRRSTIASYIAGPNLSMGSEGANEGSVVKLNNGSLLSVYRTGQPFPQNDPLATSPSLFWSMSGDDGFTWSTPKMLGVTGVYPLLRKLDDGAVALTTGRYGAKLMFADETGLRWTTPFVIHNGPSSGHTELRKNADGTYAFVYDQSGFYPPSWNASPPAGYVYDNNQSANLRSAVLNITRQTVTPQFRWAVDYDGNTVPSSLPQSWSASQSGAVSAYEWAELGQDYVRIDTGASGSANSLYYTLPAGAWSAMDFSDGVVLDVRARVSGATAEGSADVILGDGANGYLALELTGNSAILEGQGGNASQASYTEAAHPGFATETWHTYRVVVAPDPTAAGAIRAKLYLDGNLGTPILTTALNPAALDSLYFGDVTSSSNGVFDVDFLRFSVLNGQWQLDGNGNYATLNNWSSSIPSGIDRKANFLGAITSPRTVSVSGPYTVGHIRFDNLNRYTLAGAGTITLAVTGGKADITLASGNHTITAPLQLNSDTTIVGPGTLTAGDVNNAASLAVQTHLTAGKIDGVGTLTLAAGKTLTASRIRQNVLISDGSVSILAGRSTQNTSLVKSLDLRAGAHFELADNDLLIDYSGASPLMTIRSQIISGAISSSIVAGDPTKALGYGDTAALGAGTYSGQSLDASSIVLRFTSRGDANLDGVVGSSDFNLLVSGYGISANALWTHGDFNFDSRVDTLDFNLLSGNFGAAVAAPSLGSVIPEPASLMAIGAAGLLLRRSERRA